MSDQVKARVVESHVDAHHVTAHHDDHLIAANHRVIGAHTHAPHVDSHLVAHEHRVVGGTRVVEHGTHAHVVDHGTHAHVVDHGHRFVGEGRVVHRGERVVSHTEPRVVHRGEVRRVVEPHTHVHTGHLEVEVTDALPRSSVTNRSEHIVRGEARLIDSHVLDSQGHIAVVEEHELPRREIGVHARESHVTTRVGEDRVVDTRVSELVTNTYSNALAEHRTESTVSYNDITKEIVCHTQRPNVVTRTVDKYIDIVTEQPVPREVFHDVYVDIVVEKPVEKIIEKEVIKEIIIEKPVDKIIEKPYERIVEVPVEKIIEKEVYIEEIIEQPIEKIIETEVTHEVPNLVYVDRVVSIPEGELSHYRSHNPNASFLPVKVNKHVERRVEEVPVYRDHIVEHRIENEVITEEEVIVENRIDKEVITEVEIPIVEEKIIEHIEYVDRPFTTVREVVHEVEHPVYVDNIVEKVVVKPVVVEEIVHVDKPVYIKKERPVTRTVHEEVWTDVVHQIENVIKRPNHIVHRVENPVIVENIVERPVVHWVEEEEVIEREEIVRIPNVRTEFVDTEVEEVIEHHMTEIIEHPVERRVEKVVTMPNVIVKDIVEEVEIWEDVEEIVEQVEYKERIIEEEIIYEQEVQVPVERIVERIEEVRVPRRVEVIKEVVYDRPVLMEELEEVEVIEEKIIPKRRVNDVHVEVEVDADLYARVEEMRTEYELLRAVHEQLNGDLVVLQREWSSCTTVTDWASQCRELAKINADLQVRITQLRQKTQVGKTKEVQVTTVYTEDPAARALRMRIAELKAQNASVMSKIQFHDSGVHASHLTGNALRQAGHVSNTTTYTTGGRYSQGGRVVDSHVTGTYVTGGSHMHGSYADEHRHGAIVSGGRGSHHGTTTYVSGTHGHGHGTHVTGGSYVSGTHVTGGTHVVGGSHLHGSYTDEHRHGPIISGTVRRS